MSANIEVMREMVSDRQVEVAINTLKSQGISV